MDQSTLILFLLSIASSVFILFLIFIVPTFGTKSREARQIRQRLKNFNRSNLTEKRSLVQQKYLRELSPLQRFIETFPGTESIEHLVERSGNSYPAYFVISSMIITACLTGFTTWHFSSNLYIAIGSFLLAGYLPLLKIKSDYKKRMALFEEQLPEALDMLTRALRAGYSFNEAMHYIAQEMQDPIAKEFGLTFEEINYGRDIRQAFNHLIQRVPSSSLISATTAIIIQQETGGNLAELLEKVSNLLRRRFHFARKVKIITAEARISAWILALLPLLVFLFLTVNSLNYVKPLFITDIGNQLLGIALILQIIGTLWIRKLIDFEI
nr:secretion system protein [Rhodospirillales bacterium]